MLETTSLSLRCGTREVTQMAAGVRDALRRLPDTRGRIHQTAADSVLLGGSDFGSEQQKGAGEIWTAA